MGAFIAKLLQNWSDMFKKPARILMVGLDGAGKTTLLYKLKLGENVHSIPTIGFNCEKVQFKNVEFTIWDIGGQHTLRKLWHYYYNGSDAVVYLVDSAEAQDRIQESKEELFSVLDAEELPQDAAVLVLANKQDLPKALSPNKVAEAFELERCCRGREWFVQGCCATSGDGVFEGLDWLSRVLNGRKK
eukprot:gb/GECG01006765.1/.p1 GENE.gb/GECG01006765.1/~~gb/GECG01006765.1/.p1  ORF type:complete len:188 (+),score=28.44 gb/GECG01006765.1/:1-564(+)